MDSWYIGACWLGIGMEDVGVEVTAVDGWMGCWSRWMSAVDGWMEQVNEWDGWNRWCGDGCLVAAGCVWLLGSCWVCVNA